MRTSLSPLAALLGLCLQLVAADPFYYGTWKIVSAAPAPWANAELTPDQPEMKELNGKTVAFSATEITGPRQAACKGPKYKVKDYPADMLFQGMFGEMHSRDKSVDPVKMAAKAGFQAKGPGKPTWKTVETGCGNELDWHFIDPMTAVFGLNNVVYTLKKQ